MKLNAVDACSLVKAKISLYFGYKLYQNRLFALYFLRRCQIFFLQEFLKFFKSLTENFTS